jgi:hypothetical protein
MMRQLLDWFEGFELVREYDGSTALGLEPEVTGVASNPK